MLPVRFRLKIFSLYPLYTYKFSIMKLTDSALKSFHVAKIFTENTAAINSLDFTHDGSIMVSSSVDDSIITYDCQKGSKLNTLNSKKYGVDLIRITHHQTSAVHASTKIDDTVRYLSLHDNKYFRYFSGHTKRVVSLSMSRVDDTFISGSLDNTLRLWDLRSPNCQGCMHMTNSPVATFDPEGLIFAAGINSEQIKLYDLRSFDRGPFTTFTVQSPPGNEWTNLKFSMDGKMILITTKGSLMHLIDAYEGRGLQQFSGFENKDKLPLEGGFTPDSQFVYCGSTDAKIHIWNANCGSKLCILTTEQQSGHRGPIRCLGFNPQYMMFASACSRMVFWLPQLDTTS